LGAVFLTYLPVVSAGYIWDDDFYVTNNLHLRTLAGLKRIWLASGATPQYYPLVFSSFWIEYQLWGLSPLGYHLINVLLHGVGAVLLYRALTVLAVPGAFLAAALFAVHPVQVESVAWVTERKNVLSGVFYLLAFLAYWRLAPADEAGADVRRQWRWYALSLVFFGCAVLSKSVTCSLPAAILLVIWWKRGRLTLRDIVPLVPMFAIGLAAAWNTASLEAHHVGAQGAEWSWTPLERCLIAGRAAWFYVGKLLWPRPLIFIYPKWLIDASQGWQSVFPCAALLLVAGLWLGRRRMGLGPLTGVLLFGGTILPALGFINVYPMRYSFVADHFQYLACIGLIATMAGLAATMAKRHRIPAKWQFVASTALLAALSLTSLARCFDYQSRETLWTATVRDNPNGWMAIFHLGGVRMEQGRYDEAIALFQQALRPKPGNEPSDEEQGDLHHFLGDCYAAIGDSKQAAAQYLEAADDYGRMPAGDLRSEAQRHNSLGIVHGKLGETEAALNHFRQAVEIRPDDAKMSQNLGEFLFHLQRYEESAEIFEKALAVDPSNAHLHYDLGVLYLSTGNRPLALKHLREAVRIEPGFKQARAVLTQAGGQ
jgi:tetratricopeptide (TPR) repeat protein